MATSHSLPTAPRTNSENFRILLIEDDGDIARVVLTTLQAAGLECRYAPDGRIGLAAFHQTNPHLILLDLMMPGMDGQQVCTKIRETSTVPIVMLTARTSEEDQIQGFRCGADDYIPKPFNPRVLLARVIAHLRRVYRYDASGAEAIDDKTAKEEDPISKTPLGWATCDACGYMGPREKFEKEDFSGRRFMICPVCQQTEHIAISIG